MRRPGYQDGHEDGDGLLERAEQLALLDEVLASVAGGGRGRTVLVAGEAGVGKTALLRGFGDGVAGSARVLWAGCDHLLLPGRWGRSWTWPGRPAASWRPGPGMPGFPHARVTSLVTVARARARRGEVGYRPLLDEAARVAKAAPVGQVAPLVAAARGGRMAGGGTDGADRR